jgi:hypothetical protein
MQRRRRIDAVYEEVRSLDSFQPWLDMIQNFPVELIHSACKEIPRCWFNQDEGALVQMIDLLLQRRSRLIDTINDVRRNRPAIFPNWK